MAEDELRDARDTPAGALGTPGSISASDRFGLLGRSTLLRNGLLAVAGIFISWLLVTSLSSGTDQQLQQIPAYACAAIGLTLLVGFSGQISLGHGAFMMIGGYTFALLWPKWQGHPNLTIAGALAAALAVSALAGGIVGIAGARLRGPYLAGATLALAVGLPSLTQYEKLSKHLKGSEGLSIPSPPTPHGFDFIQWPLFVGLVCMVILLFFTANLSRSRIGREMRAVRDDEIAASLAGLSVPRVQVLAFVISAAWAGLGGALFALANSNASPGAFGLALSLAILAATVIGGLGSLTGAVVGAVFVVMLTNYWARDLADALNISSQKVAHNLPLLIYGVLLALTMLVAPGGIAGSVRRLIALLRPSR